MVNPVSLELKDQLVKLVQKEHKVKQEEPEKTVLSENVDLQDHQEVPVNPDHPVQLVMLVPQEEMVNPVKMD